MVYINLRLNVTDFEKWLAAFTQYWTQRMTSLEALLDEEHKK